MKKSNEDKKVKKAKEPIVMSVMSKDAVEALVSFMKHVPKMTVLPADDMKGAAKGYLAYYGNDDKNEIWFGWQFAKPLEDTRPILAEILGTGDEMDIRAQAMIRKCISEDRWVKCDDPKNLILGFAKYAPLDSPDKSECVLLTLHGMRRLPDDLRKEIIAWREKKSQKGDAVL